MSKRTTTPGRIRTAAALKADAGLLAGDRSRVAKAAADDTPASAPDGETIGELWLYGVVGGWWRGFDAESVSNAIRGLDVDTLFVRIHSPGGRAADGIAIANLLRNHKAKVVTVIDGLAASAASVIAIAGDEVVMCPGSRMMIHDVSLGTYGNAGQLRRDADWLDGESDNYASVYAHKAGGTDAHWRELMAVNDGEGTWYSAADAVAAKLADSVGTRPAAGSPPTAPEDEIDDNDEDALARIEHDLALLEQHVHPAARAAWQGRTAKPPTASAGGSVTTEGGSAVAFSDAQLTTMRDTLQLPADADESAIVAAVAAVVEESIEERPADTSATAGIPAGHVSVPEVRLKDLETAAQAGAQAAKTLHDRDREAFLDEHKAKFPAASREEWAKQYDANPSGTRALLERAGELVPTSEVGDAVEGDAAATVESVKNDPNYKNWRF